VQNGWCSRPGEVSAAAVVLGDGDGVIDVQHTVPPATLTHRKHRVGVGEERRGEERQRERKSKIWRVLRWGK
jgi:hypothetical protein